MTDEAPQDDFMLVHRRADHPDFPGDTVTVHGITMDRRQCLAAAILLSAVDLPQPAGAVAQLWLDAARVCPGITTGEVTLGAGRVAQLQQVQRLVADMLAQADRVSGSVT